jgi:Mrp family chromosome partitioning ATPase
MRASDYDYIIFDMPPMSQISITPRLARFMDMVLLVVESEKTDRDVAKRATNVLLETKTNVGVVLNKSRDHLPRRLQQDI